MREGDVLVGESVKFGSLGGGKAAGSVGFEPLSSSPARRLGAGLDRTGDDAVGEGRNCAAVLTLRDGVENELSDTSGCVSRLPGSGDASDLNGEAETFEAVCSFL